jgi:transcription elongation factor SPT5
VHHEVILKYFFAEYPQIKSITVPNNVKGIIYVETDEKSHVMSIIENMEQICGIVMLEQEPMPINKMPDLLQVKEQRSCLKAKQWVRVKGGIYKNDLAQIHYVHTRQDQVQLKLIPRIDYRLIWDNTQNRLYDALKTKSKALKQKKERRPAAKLFDAEAIRAIGGEVTSDGNFLIFEGNKYSYKGLV